MTEAALLEDEASDAGLLDRARAGDRAACKLPDGARTRP